MGVASDLEAGGFVPSTQNTYRRARQMLVSTRHAADVEKFLRDRVGAEVRHDDSDDVGIVCFEWDGDDAVDRIIDELRTTNRDRWSGWQPELSPNHLFGTHIDVLTGQPMDIGSPQSRPHPSRHPLAPRRFLRVGQGVTVGVIDTGIAPHPWMEGSVLAGARDLESHRLDVAPADHRLDPQAGHGTFVAGLVLRQAPGATVRVAHVLDSRGLADARDVAKAIARMASAGVDVVNLSLGGYTRSNQPPMALRKALALVPATTAVVAAAGNHDPDNPQHQGFKAARPLWPAALEGVISVAALDANGARPAAFSNFGPWVDVWTRGEDVESTFVTFQGQGEDEQFEGWARWSGTSFAAPAVAGAVAARMSLDGGISGAEAARRLLAEATPMAHPSGPNGHPVEPNRALDLPPLV